MTVRELPPVTRTTTPAPSTHQTTPARTSRPALRTFPRPRTTSKTSSSSNPAARTMLFQEFFGSFLLGLFGLGVTINLTLQGAPVLLSAAMTFGFLLFLQAYWYDESGCHLNPWVTIAAVVGKSLPAREIPGYIVSQFVGFGLSVFVLYHLFGDAGRLQALFGAAIPAATSTTMTMILGGFLSVFLFTTFVLSVTDKPEFRPVIGLVGIVLGVVIYFSAELTGGGVNLARELMPISMAQFDLPFLLSWDKIPAELLRWPSAASFKRAFDAIQWTVIISEFVGAIAAGLFYRKVIK